MLKTTKAKATGRAKALARHLGKGWKIRVWNEEMYPRHYKANGWFCSVRNRGMTVYIHDDGYSACASSSEDGIGEPGFLQGITGKKHTMTTVYLTPDEAIFQAVRRWCQYHLQITHRTAEVKLLLRKAR
jgi:hypothetical protein